MPANEEDIKLLKTMVSAAKKNPVNIGICLGKKPENAIVVMDRKRPADALGRAAKKDGETTKICVGTVTVDGRNATLTVDGKPPSGVAKQMKLFFKSIDLPLVFELRDIDGNAIDDDAGDDEENEGESSEVSEPGSGEGGETAPDPAQVAFEAAWADAEPKLAEAMRTNIAGADRMRAVRDFMLGKAGEGEYGAAQKSLQTLLGLMNAGGQTPPQSTPQPEPKPTGPDPKELVEKMKALKPQIAALTGPLAQLLNERYAKAVALIKPATITEAAAEIAKIEAALARVQSEVTTEGVGTNPSADPRFAKIIVARDKLQGQIGALGGGDAHDAMMKIIDSISESIQKGEAETALAGMKRIQDGLKLQAEIDRLAPLVAEAASSGKVADVNAMNLLFNMVVDAVPAPDQAKAMASLARVEEMIAAGEAAPSTFEREIPDDVKPIAVSQLNWVSTRSKVRSEIGRLQTAIRATLQQVGGMEDAIKEVDKLLDYVVKIDGRLEDKMNDIVNAPAGDDREKLKREARVLLAEYQAELSNPFFDDVDSGNGFADVDVAASAKVALDRISEVLAA